MKKVKRSKHGAVPINYDIVIKAMHSLLVATSPRDQKALAERWQFISWEGRRDQRLSDFDLVKFQYLIATATFICEALGTRHDAADARFNRLTEAEQRAWINKTYDDVTAALAFMRDMRDMPSNDTVH
jgi:hypothetical protein